ARGPEVMGRLAEIMIAFDVHGNVGTEIVGYAIRVALRVVQTGESTQVEYRQRQRNGSACAVDHVHGYAVAMREPIVPDEVDSMWLVEAGGVITPVVDILSCQRVMLLEERAREGIAKPAVEPARRLFYQQLSAIGFAPRREDIRLDVMVQHQVRPTLVIEVVGHTTVVDLDGGLDGPRLEVTVVTQGELIAMLWLDIRVTQFPYIGGRDRDRIGQHVYILLQRIEAE